MFPPLANNPVVNGDLKLVNHILDYGLAGPIEVGGAKYNGQMPAWKGNLSDQQIADVVTYVRSAFGNKAGPDTAAAVGAVAK